MPPKITDDVHRTNRSACSAQGGVADYRERIYENYVTARHKSFSPETVKGFLPRAPYFHRVIRKHFPDDRNATILEIGCGHGAFIYYLRDAGYERVSGVDRSPEQVSEAHRLGVTGVTQGDLLPTLATTAPDSVDVLIAFDVIEHLRKDEAITLAEAANRVLRANGKFILHTVNADSPFFGANRYGDFTHEIAYNPTSIGQLFITHGFSKVQCFEDAPIPHGLKSTVRLLLWKGIRSVLRLYTAVETGDIGRNAVYTRNFLTVATK